MPQHRRPARARRGALKSRWSRVLGLVIVSSLALAIGVRLIDEQHHRGTVVFDGGFAAGISPPWDGIQACPGEGGSSFTRVTSPQSRGDHAAKATVRGRCRFGSQRAEVVGPRAYTQGTELYFGHSVLFPSSFPARQSGWCVTMQIHTALRGATGAPSALSLNCRDADSDATLIRAQSNPGCTWHTALVRDVWLHFVWRVHFDSANGSWDLWYRDDRVTAYRHVVDDCRSNVLLAPDDRAYWKLGLYRGSANRDVASVYHADAKVGTSFDAVAR
jgi:Polysaccharide lyase